MSDGQMSDPMEETLLVPATLPPVRTDVPPPVRAVRGLLALPGMVLLWLMPKTFGVRLAASGWWAAIAAHLVGLAFGGGMIVWAAAYPWANPAGMAPVTWGMPELFTFDVEFPAPAMTTSEVVRGPIVALVILVHQAIAFGGLSRFIWFIVAIESIVLLMAVATMPFAAAGERVGPLFARCVQLALWSTTILIPIGFLVMLHPILRGWLGLPNEWTPFDFAAIALMALWWIVVLLRSAGRYAGPAEGPAWEARTPRCEGCGYTIAQIPVTTNCPECGRTISESLPERRGAPALVTASGLIATTRLMFRTQRDVLNQRDFFERLSLHRDCGKDLRYFFILAVVISLPISLVIRSIASNEAATEQDLAICAVSSIAFFIVQVLGVGLGAVVVALVGRRSMQTAAIWMVYALSLVYAFMLGMVLILFGLLGVLFAAGVVEPSIGLIGAAVGSFGAALGLVGGVWLCWRAVERIRHAVKATRIANG